MARPYRRRAVLFVNRAYSHDPHERVDAIGGINSDRSRWRLSQTAAIAAIEAGTDEFFVKTADAAVKLVVARIGARSTSRASVRKRIPTIC